MPPAVPTIIARILKAAGAIALAGALAALAGCGGDKPDVAAGKQLFTQRCGSCHSLADANTKGAIGPNLDDAFKQDVADGLGRDTIEGVVREQIKLPQGRQMPPNLVTGNDAKAVAAYVASVVGKSAGTTGAGTTGPTGPTGAGGTAKTNARDEVEIPTDPTGQLEFQVTSAQAKAGKVTLLSKNDSSVPHNISIEGGGVNKEGPTVSGGKTSKLTVSLKPGKYDFYCSVPGHRQAGMQGTLTVK
jgi:mono/diheme cytochrome c family protein